MKIITSLCPNTGILRVRLVPTCLVFGIEFVERKRGFQFEAIAA